MTKYKSSFSPIRRKNIEYLPETLILRKEDMLKKQAIRF